MRKVLSGTLIALTLGMGTAKAEYFLFAKEKVLKSFKEEIPFKIKDFGEYWEIGAFKDKTTALNFQNEFLVRFGIIPSVANFKDEKNFSSFMKIEQVGRITDFLKDLELLKEKIKRVRDPKFNNCYFINEINGVERCIIKEFDLETNFPKLVEKIFYPAKKCNTVTTVNTLVQKEIVIENLKNIIEKYSDYEDIVSKLENILQEMYSTF